MTVRLRRLKSDYDKICTAFGGDSRIRILKTVGNPPEKYQMEYLVTSLQKNLGTQKLHTHNAFIVEVTLTSSYPRMAPQCKMITPVFHPNIAPHAICIGDHWAAGESLLNLMIRIGEMLSYQSYNIKSPLNGEAARWADQNRHRLPTDRFDFSVFLSAGQTGTRGAAAAGTGACANCGKAAEESALQTCSNDHLTCPDCALHCEACNALLCLKCDIRRCAIDHSTLCPRCVFECGCCQRQVSIRHTDVCQECGQRRCKDCLVVCDRCGKLVCIDHITKRVVAGTKQYFCPTCQS